MSLNVRLHDMGSARPRNHSKATADSLSVEQTPVALDAAELVVLPLLVKHLHRRARSSADLQQEGGERGETHLEEEVAGAVRVSLADECVEERLCTLSISLQVPVDKRRSRVGDTYLQARDVRRAWPVSETPDIFRALKTPFHESHAHTRAKGGTGRTDGQPVSAIYIVGLFGSASATTTLFPWKNSAVHPAASAADVFANHGCTFDICARVLGRSAPPLCHARDRRGHARRSLRPRGRAC